MNPFCSPQLWVWVGPETCDQSEGWRKTQIYQQSHIKKWLWWMHHAGGASDLWLKRKATIQTMSMAASCQRPCWLELFYLQWLYIEQLIKNRANSSHLLPQLSPAAAACTSAFRPGACHCLSEHCCFPPFSLNAGSTQIFLMYTVHLNMLQGDIFF